MINARIFAAGKTLSELNQQYSALLRHSGKTIAVLASLCKNYTGQFFPAAQGAPAKHQTWSCEA
jgi:hypothetical protein